MLTMSRRGVLASAAIAAAFGLPGKRLAFIDPARAEAPLEPANGVYKYKVGAIEVTAVYDGIWRKPHDPTFIKNASIEDTREALAKAGLATEFMPIPLTVTVLEDRRQDDHDGRRIRRRPVASQCHQSARQHEGCRHRP